MTSKAQIKATSKYESINYDKILLRLPKGYKAVISSKAKENNMSVNNYITSAVCSVAELDKPLLKQLKTVNKI